MAKLEVSRVYPAGCWHCCNKLRKEAKEKGTWVHLKPQSAPPRGAQFVSTNGKEPEQLELIPYEFTDCKSCKS
eukprot:bmy_18603T0